MARTAIKRKTERVPADLTELEQYVANIRREERKIMTVEENASQRIAKLETRIEWIKKQAQLEVDPIQKEINELARGVYIFAQGNKEKLVEEAGKKTVTFSGGDGIRWYFPRPSVIVEDEEAAIAELKKNNLSSCIRTKEEVDKAEVLKHAEEITAFEHLSIEQSEIFAIVMAAIGIELQKGKRKFKKVPL